MESPVASAELRVVGQVPVGPVGTDAAQAVGIEAPPVPVALRRLREDAAPASTGAHDTSASSGSRTSAAHERWARSIARFPLETPRPLGAEFSSLAAAITGRRSPVRWTSGMATRRALAAAGAQAATSGDVLHLADPPGRGPDGLRRLTHELTHLRTPLPRARFMLSETDHGHGPDHEADHDERTALVAGEFAETGPTGGGREDTARSAGIVGDLTVSGAAAVAQAVRAARQVATEVLSPRGAAAGLPDTLVPASSGAGAGGASGLPASTDGSAQITAQTSTGELNGESNTEGPTASGGHGGAARSGTVGRPGPSAASLDEGFVDALVVALEARMLAEAERRGGRWAGVF